MLGIQPIERVETHGKAALFHAIVDDAHEGIVGKRMDAPYRAGKSASWVKIKNREYSRPRRRGVARITAQCTFEDRSVPSPISPDR